MQQGRLTPCRQFPTWSRFTRAASNSQQRTPLVKVTSILTYISCRRAMVAGGIGIGAGDGNAAPGGKLLYALEANHNDGPWEAPERVRKYSAVLRYSTGTADQGYSVTAMAYRNRWNATDQVPLRAVESGLIGRYGTLDASDGGDSARYSLSYQQRWRDAASRSELSAYAIRSSLDLFSNFTYLLADPGQGDQFNQSERRTVAGFDAGHTWLHALNGIEMRSKIGAQGRYDKLSPVGLYATRARQRTGTIREDLRATLQLLAAKRRKGLL
eukprot:gene40948-50665_t